jgi:hypothetical protein
MRKRRGLCVACLLVALLLCSPTGCSLFDPPEVRVAKAMNRQMDSMQKFADEIDKGMKERQRRRVQSD